jgi:protein-disulfide isomerase
MDMRAANSVLWGKAGLPAFYAFVDPNCPHCQYFLKQVEPFVNAGEVAVHLILVGYNDKSRQQAALVLASGDGPQRLVAYAKGQADQLPAPEKISVDAVKANVDLMHDWDLTATPIIVYQAGKGGEIKLIRGRPLDMAGAVKDLKG